MKKYITTLLIILLSLNALFAANTFLQPMLGTGGIPMDPVREQGGAYPYSPITYKTNGWADLGSNAPYVEKQTNHGKGKYSNAEIMAIGGINNVDKSTYPNDNITVKLHPTSSKGFFFVSQKNPYYRRPYELYVIPRVTMYEDTWRLTDTLYQFYASPIPIRDGSSIVEFTFNTSKILEQCYKADVYFDIVLALPGNADENSNLVDDMNRIFPLTSADDYSALVNINMQVDVNGKAFAPAEGLEVPATGYFKTSAPEVGVNETSISMYIYPSALSGSLNMKAYNERQAIADIEVLGINKLSSADDFRHDHPLLSLLFGEILDAILGNAQRINYAVFLSSNPSPFTAGEHFLMKKDNLESSVDIKPSQYNSIPFSIVLVDNLSPTLREITYSGTDTFDTNNKPTLDKKEDFNKLITGFPKLFIPEGNDVRATNSSQNNLKLFQFKGTAYLVLEDNSSVIMEAGRYTGEVYVHVVDLL